MHISFRWLFLVPGTAGLFLFVAGLGEHEGLRRMVLACLLFALTLLLLLASPPKVEALSTAPDCSYARASTSPGCRPGRCGSNKISPMITTASTAEAMGRL